MLAGGTGSRLWPITWGVSKQLLPIYDKPLIYYPISTLMLSGIREILIITTPEDEIAFKRLLGNGRTYGIDFQYQTQDKPEGIAQAFVIGQEFVGQDSCSLVLGDNIFYGIDLGTQLQSIKQVEGASIFAYKVNDPERYGVVDLNSEGKVVSIEEKPQKPKSSYAVTGLYFYDNSVLNIAKDLKPSLRGELEITDINRAYLEQDKLHVKILDRGTAWFDTGTFESLNAASNFIRIIEERQSLKIACLEEIAWKQGWISDKDLHDSSIRYRNSIYGEYLRQLLR